jgi:hypothetical protein
MDRADTGRCHRNPDTKFKSSERPSFCPNFTTSMIHFNHNDPSLEQQWRGIILFGRNSASYKFAFAKSLLSIAEQDKNSITLEDLAIPFSKEIVHHLNKNPVQGTSKSSKFLEACRSFIADDLSLGELHSRTAQLGFNNVVDAFHNVHGEAVDNPFYTKDYSGTSKRLVFTDDLFKLKETVQFGNLLPETEARWTLVETAWNLGLSPHLIQVQHDSSNNLLYLNSSQMLRVDLSSARDALNGYQKGKCFYSFKDISIESDKHNFCDVDHFFPHVNKQQHLNYGSADLNGVWNLVLADSRINRHDKRDKLPHNRYLERLHNRNEFYINSKHPLSETIQNQTGKTEEDRRRFLQKQFDIARTNCLTPIWEPSEELPGTF